MSHIIDINGPIVRVKLPGAKNGEQVQVGALQLVGEIIALEGDDAIAKNRKIMGATNPAEADEGTIRKLYANSIGENTVHGSDSAENARIEVNYFFRGTEIC